MNRKVFIIVIRKEILVDVQEDERRNGILTDGLVIPVIREGHILGY